MKANEILTYLLYGILLIAGAYVAFRLIKWLIGLILAGTSMLLVLIYAFAPIIIIVLLVIILIKMGRQR